MSFKLSDLKEGMTIEESQWIELLDDLLLNYNYRITQHPIFTEGICEVHISPVGILNIPIDFFNPEYKVHPKESNKIKFFYKLQ